MHLEVRLYGSLRRYRPAGAPGAPQTTFEMILAEDATVDDLCEQLGIPHGLVTAASVNDTAVETSASLSSGDRVRLFPPSAGGSQMRPSRPCYPQSFVDAPRHTI